MGMTMLIASLPFLPLLARLPPTITKTSSIDAGSSYSSPTLLCSCHNVCCTSPPPNICSSLSCYTCFASVLLCYVCFMFQSKHDCTYVAVAPSLKTRLANTLVRLLGVLPKCFRRDLCGATRHPRNTKHNWRTNTLRFRGVLRSVSDAPRPTAAAPSLPKFSEFEKLYFN